MNLRITKRLGQSLAVGLLVAVTTAAVANLAYAAYFTGRVMPGVAVAGVALGGQDRAQAMAALAHAADSYILEIVIGSRTYHLKPAQIGVNFDLNQTYQNAYASGRSQVVEAAGLLTPQTEMQWVYTVDSSQFDLAVAQISRDNTGAAINPTVIINGTTPQIKPGSAGFGIDAAELGGLIKTAFSYRVERLTLHRAAVKPGITVASLAPAIERAKILLSLHLELIDGANHVFKPDATTIGSWLALDESGPIPVWQVDQAKLAGYVAGVAQQIYLPPVNLNITMVNGVEQSRTGGANGSALDQAATNAALAQAVNAGQSLQLAMPRVVVAYRTLTNNTNDLNAPKYIEVNLTTQHLWAYQDHQLVYESAVTSGATGAGFQTVQGLFAIYSKERNRWLNGYSLGYNYDVFVQYWMPFYVDYGLHDASWRNNFGGADYYYGGSHGCINLPLATAAWLYGWDEIGTPVWVHT